jgi:hypothetical protein
VEMFVMVTKHGRFELTSEKQVVVFKKRENRGSEATFWENE